MIVGILILTSAHVIMYTVGSLLPVSDHDSQLLCNSNTCLLSHESRGIHEVEQTGMEVQDEQRIQKAVADRTEIPGLLDQLSELVAGLSTDDLPALGEVHTAMEAVAQSASSRCGGSSLVALAERGATLAGQMMLGDCGDMKQALKQLGQIVSMLNEPSSGNPNMDPAVASIHIVPTEGICTSAPSSHVPIDPEPGLNPEDTPLICDFISEAASHLDAAEAKLLVLEQCPTDSDAIDAVFRSFHTIKGVAGFLNFKQVGALAHAAENLLDQARQRKLEIHGAIANLIFAANDTMRCLIASVTEATKFGMPIPVNSELPTLIARLKDAARGEMPPTSDFARVITRPAKSGSAPAEQRPADERRVGDRREGDGTVKVATDRLDNLINMVGELVITQSMVSQDVVGIAVGNHRLLRNLSQLGKMTRELQDLSMAMRMVPIQGVFQKMSRLVRDLGQKAGKQIELVINGGETELDRNVVEAIGDPLVHMVRNSADHGVEVTEDRIRAGKSPTGRIELRAEHCSGAIRIQISDDGRGLNKKRILKKAVDAGLIREGQELSDQEIFRLIFHAGLSTAEKLTDISGRGVGMDVVKRNIEAIRGRIDIASVEGKGATFTIWLPLTLAVIDGLLVRVGSHRYILPITSIEHSMRPKPEQIHTIQSRGEMCHIRGTFLPLFRLHSLFGIQPDTEDPTEALIVVVRDNERQCCLFVDEVLGQQQVVIKSLGEGIGHVSGVSGGAILGDGNVSLILDVSGIIDLAQGSNPSRKPLMSTATIEANSVNKVDHSFAA